MSDRIRNLPGLSVIDVRPYYLSFAQDTPKATSASNVSCHLIHLPPIHGQTYLIDPMHACLNVDEIVRFVAHELVVSSGERSAVSLACCRKSFEDPVLGTLWAEQDVLLPLLKSLPCDVWKEGGYSVSASIVSFLSLSL